MTKLQLFMLIFYAFGAVYTFRGTVRVLGDRKVKKKTLPVQATILTCKQPKKYSIFLQMDVEYEVDGQKYEKSTLLEGKGENYPVGGTFEVRIPPEAPDKMYYIEERGRYTHLKIGLCCLAVGCVFLILSLFIRL